MRQIKTKIRYVGDVHLRCPNLTLFYAIPYYVQLRALCLRLFDDYDETSGSQRYRALDDNAKIVLVLSGLDRVLYQIVLDDPLLNHLRKVISFPMDTLFTF